MTILIILFILLLLILAYIITINVGAIVNVPYKRGGFTHIFSEIDYTDKEKELIMAMTSLLEKGFTQKMTTPPTSIAMPNIYNDLINLTEYRNIKQSKCHFPQIFLTHNCYFRKFLISQVFVLSHFYKKGAIVLYNGASNSTFLPYLISLFPSFKWHIYYDLELSYYLEESDHIHLYNKYMTIEDATKWTHKIDIVISHHRPINATKSPNEYDHLLLESLKEQSALIKEIEPKKGASLKLMLPFVSPLDNSNIELIQGKILWMPWTKPTSTDGTLIIEASDAKKNSSNMFIHLKTIQDSYATHNMIDRVWGHYGEPHLDIRGYDRCFDCAFEYTVWGKYITASREEIRHLHNISISYFMNDVSNKFEPLISIVQKSDQHGRHPNLTPIERVRYLIEHKYIQKKNISEFWKKYEAILDQNAQLYDEFVEELVELPELPTAFNGESKFSYDFNNNEIIAKKLLNTKFATLYTEKEQKYILAASKKEWPLPSIWNSLKFYIPYRGNKGGTLAHNLVYSHLGQRKLFLTEMQTITRFLKSASDVAIILYAGAAPSVHLPLMYELFPNVTWHLYDPAKFAIKECHHAKIYNEYFTDETANKWKHKCDIFICDIRLSANNSAEFEQQVDADMKMQDNWTRIIEPKLGASLKFRLPYLSEKNKMHVYKYLRGKILWQMWPPMASTECRLIVDAADINSTMDIDVVKYQNSCMEHNMIDRAWKTYQVPHKDCHKIVGYDRCFDCTCEAISWLDYMKMPNAKQKNIYDHFNSLTKITHQSLQGKKTPHGYNQYECAAARLAKL